MNYVNYKDNSDVVVGGGKLYIAKTTDIKTKVPEDISTATVATMNTLVANLIDEMNEIALVAGAGEITTANKYIDAKVQGKTFKKFPTEPEVTFKTGAAEVNVEHLASFITGGKYTATSDNVEVLSFDGETAPDDCYLMFVMEDAKDSAKYVYLMPRCAFSDTFTFSTDVEKQVTPDLTFTVLQPSEASVTSTGVDDFYLMVKVPATVTSEG